MNETTTGAFQIETDSRVLLTSFDFMDYVIFFFQMCLEELMIWINQIFARHLQCSAQSCLYKQIVAKCALANI